MKLQSEFNDLSSAFDGAILSTFVFDSDYFEKTVLPLLSRNFPSNETVVCLDSGSYQETINADEGGPSKVGKEYYLSPIRLSNGRFHPKIYFFGGEKRATAFVGSANLTGSAFDQNQEVVTKFDATNDGDSAVQDISALADIRAFYAQLLEHQSTVAIGKTARDKIRDLLEVTTWIPEAESNSGEETTTAVLHNLERPLLEQIESRLSTRSEEIQQVDIIAPFYGGGLAVPEAFTSAGTTTRLWLQQNKTQIDADAVQSWVRANPGAKAVVYDSDRYVHGKVILIQTSEAAYCLAGSPNASGAALLETVGSDVFANIEVGVFRRSQALEHFSYLRDEFEHHRLEEGLDAFTPQREATYRPPEPTTNDTVDLLGVDFTQSEVFDGGRLHGRVRLTTSVDDADKLTLSIHPLGESDSIAIQFSGTELTKTPDSSDGIFTFSRRITDGDDLVALSQPAQVRPTWNGTDGMQRWLTIESRDVDREVEAAADDDGVGSVWRTIQDIYLGGGELREERIDFLGSLAEEINTGRQADGNEKGNEGGRDDSLKESISLPTYNGSTSTADPANLLKGYYDTWTSHIHSLRNEVLNESSDTEEILRLTGKRLAAINRTNTWLAITRQELHSQEEQLEDFPTDLPETYTNIVYTQSEPGFGSKNTSVTAQFVADARGHLNSESERQLFWEMVGVNVIYGQLVAEQLVVDDEAVFESSFKSHFDALIDRCLSDHPSHSDMNRVIDQSAEALWDHYGELPQTIQRAKLTRRPPQEFRKENAAQRYVSSVLRH